MIKGLLRDYEGIVVVNNIFIRPYFLEASIDGACLDSHELATKWG